MKNRERICLQPSLQRQTITKLCENNFKDLFYLFEAPLQL